MSEPENYSPQHLALEASGLPTRIHLTEPDAPSNDVNALESQTAEFTATASGLALTSSIAALHVGLVTLGVSPRDLVIVPTLGPAALANVVRYVGATPVFVDADPTTANMDPHLLDMAIRGLVNGGTPPAAVLTTNMFGSCADYSRIEAICRHYQIPILEDAAGSLGANHDGRPAGSFGTLAAVSFSSSARDANNGDGGALVGPRHLIERARHRSSDYPYASSHVLAAHASATLDLVQANVEQTRSINARYRQVLPMIPGVSMLDIDRDGCGAGSMSVVLVDSNRRPTPGAIRRAMAEDNIETCRLPTPAHLHGRHGNSPVIGGPASEVLFSTGLCLPSSPLLTSTDQERVISSFVAALATPPEPLAEAAVIDLNHEIELRSEQPRQHQDNLVASRRAA